MKLSSAFLSLLAVANTSLANFAYTDWQTADLERWLSDHDVPHSASADRKELEAVVGKAWNQHAVEPYQNWNVEKLNSYLATKGVETKQSLEETKDSLVSQVRASWYETGDKAQEAWDDVNGWILDTWSDSQLQSLVNKYQASDSQPGGSLLERARNSYQAAAKKAGASASYPGDWLYETWTDSDLKTWLDTNGFPAPQPSNRDKLIAHVRRHSRLAYLKMQDEAAGFGAATSQAGNEYAKATDSASLAAQDAFNTVVDSWSDSRLKAYLDARGIPAPQPSETDELRALVRKHHYKAASGWTAWTFDDYSLENLKNYLVSYGSEAGKTMADKTDATREELVAAAQSAFASASSVGGEQYASMTNYLSQQAAAVKAKVFETWTESEIKRYLDSYGVPVPQGSTMKEMKALARKHTTYFKYGTSTPTGTFLADLGQGIQGMWQRVKDQVNVAADAARKQADGATKKAEEKAEEAHEEL